MEITVERKYKKPAYTIDKWYINGVFFSDGLEDPDRGLTSTMTLEEINKKKVYGQTAIPTGTYEINMNTVSPKFKDRNWAKPYGGKLPRLLDVKGYEGVLIHVGNKAEDSLGCILCGKNTKRGQLTESTITFNRLMRILLQAHLKGEKIILTIN